MWKYLCIILMISIIALVSYKFLYQETFDAYITDDILPPNPQYLSSEEIPQYYEKWDTGRRMFDSLTYDFNYLRYYT